MDEPDIQAVADAFAGASPFTGFQRAGKPEHAAIAHVYLLDDRWVLRARGLDPGTLARYRKELELLDRVRGLLPLRLPDPLPALDGNRYCVSQGLFWTMHEALEGTVILPWQELHGASQEQKRTLVRWLRDIQDATRGRFDGGDPGRLVRDVGRRYQAIRTLLSSPVRRRVESALERIGTAFPGYRSSDLVFVHGDFHYGNILVDEVESIAGLIDLDWCRVGHPMEDLAYTAMMLVRDYGNDITRWEDIDGILGWYELDESLRDHFNDYLVLYTLFDIHLFQVAVNLDQKALYREIQVRMLEEICDQE